MRPDTSARLRYGVAALGAVLIAAPGVHLFERWLTPAPAVWISHGLAVGTLALLAWRWRMRRGLR